MSFYGSRQPRVRVDGDNRLNLSGVLRSIRGDGELGDLDDLELSGDEVEGISHSRSSSLGSPSGDDGDAGFGVGSMYSFDEQSHRHTSTGSTPARSASGLPEDSGFCTPYSRHPPHQTSTPCNSQNIVRRRDNYTMSDLLERQNGLILELLGEQKKLSSSLQEVQRELKETKDTVDRLIITSNEKSQPDDKMKRKYPSSLTERLSKLHRASDKKFDASLSGSDQHNAEVKILLQREIEGSYKSEYTDVQIKLAIQRLYEGQRRAVINMRPENSERFQTNELKKKYRARRERLYARRSKFVPSKLRKKWEIINLHYMSEEEDTEDGKILVRKLSWRSEKLNELVEKLDGLAGDAAKVQKNFIPERKVRILGAASTQAPPLDAPDWALHPQFRKGKENQARVQAEQAE